MSDPKTRARLRGHMAAEGAARFLSALCLVAALVALIWKGLAAALAFAFAAGVWHMARPGPCPELDKKTGRQ